MEQRKKGIYESFFKRPMDICCALSALIVLSPVMLVTAVLVRVKLGSPIIFHQERPGKDGKIFKLCKFRSMTNQRDENGELLPDSVRLTKFGKILRSTSLDELPELWNILVGDMAVIGPRPLAVQYLPYYNEQECHRHDVRPGLSGLAQINGRNATNWPERFAYDVEYVNHITFWGDVTIILKTLGKAFARKDVAVAGTTKIVDFDKFRKQQWEEEKLAAMDAEAVK